MSALSLNVIRRRISGPTAGAWIALAVLLAVCCLGNEYFRDPQNLLNITRQVSYSGIIALGMTFVIAAGGIDLSVGSLLAFSGVLSLQVMNATAGTPEVQLAAAFLTALAVGAAGGAVNGALVALFTVFTALFLPETPVWIIVLTLFLSGMVRSMQFSSLTTLAFADIAERKMTPANTLYSTIQQMSTGMGIAVGAVALRFANILDHLTVFEDRML